MFPDVHCVTTVSSVPFKGSGEAEQCSEGFVAFVFLLHIVGADYGGNTDSGFKAVLNDLWCIIVW